MSWRTVVITGNAKLDYKMDYMVVRKSDMTTRIYIGEIGMLIIESTVISLTTMLLSELTKHKIKIIFCDENIMEVMIQVQKLECRPNGQKK